MELFDIIIPIGPKDVEIINRQLEYTKKNVIGYRNIYLISYDKRLKIKDCITISEEIFPFSIETVAKYHGKRSRNGWYLQQLLKFYAGKVIPDILDKYLVIDSDTFFFKPIKFIEDGKCLYNYDNAYNRPYFIHMHKLHPEFIKVTSKSGITHHMMFETKYVTELMNMVEKIHNKPFYDVFLEKVTDFDGAGASEYEIYFNFILKFHLDKIKVRLLNWRNATELNFNHNFDYVSYHWHLIKKNNKKMKMIFN